MAGANMAAPSPRFAASWYDFAALASSFFFQGEDGIRADLVTGVQTCALPISIRLTIGHEHHPIRPASQSYRVSDRDSLAGDTIGDCAAFSGIGERQDWRSRHYGRNCR